MEKRDLKLILSVLLILLGILLVSISLRFTAYVTKEQKKQVQFYFYDEETNCSLNGYLFIGEQLIGKTYNGYFNLTYENYIDNFKNNTNISLFGVLGSCFNSYLFFDKYWESFEINEYYFLGESLFNFKTLINSHNPSKRELIGFVLPWKVKSELNNINTNGENTLDDLSKINQYLNNKINYTKDWNFNNETNYWQTPTETLELKTGDCEDFSTTFLSLFLAYNSSLNCYNIIFSSHVTTFCRVEDYYIYYDQGKTELKKQIKNKNAETKSNLMKLKQEYFEHYGINETETRVYYAFNEQQFIEFKDDEAFIDWQYALENKKSEQDIFKNLEQKSAELQKKYPLIEEKAELRTEKPELATKKPTLKGFFAENFLILFVFGIVFIFLIIVLIRVNVKR